VLLLLLGSLTVAAGANGNACPNQQCVAEDYAAHVGAEVRFWGTVTSSDPVTVRSHTEPSLRLRLRGVETPVSENTRFVFYGTVERNQVVTVTEYVVHGSTNRRAAIALSIVAYPLVGVLWIREWMLDWHRLAFRRREEDG
jgi:hypothetical protein